ncbi:uncharacterized protein related with DNA repair [Anaerolinea thermolimosa]|uniref:RAMP superfamily CRISPR-associated protein n=1 Tax=Anaerolinea thermolimosa TaxID=229919 RepID=UPI000782BE2B|nr:RAMP superfamily CRISPR-associated protein [Anaerolinea thermolimosa]GAP06113.1 uncharacterized protein related with DNA repair [Anaerolinea thermolimosa]
MSYEYWTYLSKHETYLSKHDQENSEDSILLRHFHADISGDKDTKNSTRADFLKKRKEKKPLSSIKATDIFRYPEKPLLPSWLAIKVDFELKRPWYSKDDRVFHILENPLRKEHLFDVPYIPATTWKGLLRWSCRMQSGLRQHLEKYNGKLEGWKDPDWIVDLFGNEKGEEEHFNQGVLAFYPTWFDQIGYEVINPHDRSKRAGTQPVYYEVVPAGASGTLFLLYAPFPGMTVKSEQKTALRNLFLAIEVLLTHYGISAKRTSGWGTAQIKQWYISTKSRMSSGDLTNALSQLETLLSGEK